jgi:hypothetical protein
VSGSVSLDKSGIYTNVGVTKSHDSKLGFHVQAGVGAGVKINASQAARAWDLFMKAVNSVQFFPPVPARVQ